MLAWLGSLQTVLAQQAHFSDLGILSSPRWSPAVLELNDKFYFAGGWDSVTFSQGFGSATMDVYDANIGQLNTFAMPFEYTFGDMFDFFGSPCLIGGFTENGYSPLISCLDETNGQFDTLGFLPSAFGLAGFVAQVDSLLLLEGDSLLFGTLLTTGAAFAYPLPPNLLYLPYTNRFVHDGFYYAMQEDSFFLGGKAQFHKLELATGTWTLSSVELPIPLVRAGQIVVRDTLYLFGGLDPVSFFPSNVVQGYDIKNDTYFSLPTLSAFRFDPWVAVQEGKIYIGGGSDDVPFANGGTADVVEVFDLATQTFDSSLLSIYLHHRADALSNGNRIILGGGSATAGGLPVPLDGLEELTPAVASKLERVDLTGIRVYPNPTTGLLRISWPHAADQRVTVVDALGKTVYQGMLASPYQEIELGHLSAGFYHLMIQTQKGHYVHPITLRK
ncbi:MAG: T9SS type A sorting domain-containing protein [Bacteroidota bacterium]